MKRAVLLLAVLPACDALFGLDHLRLGKDADVDGPGHDGPPPDALTCSSLAMGGFEPQQIVGTAAGPEAIAIGDLDNDGRADIVTGNGGGTVSALFNNGAMFKLVSVNLSAPITAVAIGNLDQDGFPDIYAVSGGANGTYFIHSSGDGTLVAHPVTMTGTPYAVALGKLAGGDDLLDPAIALRTNNTFGINRNNGDGTFALQSPIAVTAGPSDIAVADLDADGAPDVVTSGSSAMKVSLRFGPSFSSSSDLSTGTSPQSVTTGRFDLNMSLDVAVVDYGEGSLTFLLNAGSRQFNTSMGMMILLHPTSVEAGNLGGATGSDIAIGSDLGAQIEVLRATTTGSYSPVMLSVGMTPTAVAIGDINGDGLADVVAANRDNNTVSVLYRCAQ